MGTNELSIGERLKFNESIRRESSAKSQSTLDASPGGVDEEEPIPDEFDERKVDDVTLHQSL